MAYRKPFVEATFSPRVLPPEDTDVLARWATREIPYCDYFSPQISLGTRDFQRIVERIAAARHIVCVAGPLAPARVTTAIQKLASHLGAVVLADINSGLRFHAPSVSTLALYNLYLRGASAQLPPADLVLYFGDRIVSEPLREYLAASRPDFLLCSSYPLRQDAIENEFIYPTMKVWSDPCAFAEGLCAALPARQPTALTRALQTNETAVSQQLGNLLHVPAGAALSEGRMVYEIFQHTHDDTAVYLSASLLFREAEYFVPCLPQRLFVGANRGATGIDGVLSSGIGFGEGLGKPCTILIGDQALLHDLNALALVASARVPIYVIVINNYSGAIFHFFDLGETGKRLQNPHEWDFRYMAENFHLAYMRPSSPEAFIRAYKEAQSRQCSMVFELVVDGAASVRLFQAASANTVERMERESIS
jgi:2-succinyl-5-enolpyruvyl-6-hydroxy-3-cyclohexene-1-carboxylate synthase